MGVLLAAAAPHPSSRIGRLGRVLALEDQRAGGVELARYLDDRDRGIRRRAALAAGRIGVPALVPGLLEQMNDPEPEVRQMAAFALGLIGNAAAADRLAAALADADGRVRSRAAEALGRIGDRSYAGVIAQRVVAEIPEGARQLAIRGDDPGRSDDPWAELRFGLLALARIADPAAARTALMDGARPRFDWWAATFVAMRVGGEPLRPVLSAAARSTDAHSRALAARGLASFQDEAALGEVVGLTADEDPRVAASALRALQRFTESRWAARIAAAALDSPHAAVQAEALRALRVLPAERAVRGRVVDLIGSEDHELRAEALRLLARIDPEQFALVRSGLDPDPVWFVRAALARALGDVGDQASLQQLFTMLNGEGDPRVLPAVLEALRQVRGPDSVPTHVRQLEHADPAVRRAAALGLVSLGARGRGDALAHAYRRSISLGEAAVEPRLAIVEALAAEDAEPARALLAEIASEDPAYAVRQRAVAARGDDDAAANRRDRGSRAPLDYRAAAAPLNPFPGVPLFTPRAVIHTPRGTIELHLDTLEAPLATASFIALARRGFYDGLDFHSVVTGFAVQGGDPRGDGIGGPGYRLRSELGERPFGRGAVGLALAGPDTGGSRFFITQFPAPHLDGEYPLFGQVVRGMEVVDALRPGDRIERVEIWDGS